jgi:hypothetical protein
MNSDFKELLQTFNAFEVEYLVIGAYAVIRYTQPRYTKDLDLWIGPSPENAERVIKAFNAFGIGLFGGVEKDDFAHPGLMFSVGVPPVRIDFLTSVPPLEFEGCWARRNTVGNDHGFPIHYLSKSDLLIAKQSAGRLQDLADIEEIQRTDGMS